MVRIRRGICPHRRGPWALRQATRLVVHQHEHTHDNDTHTHLHIHTETHTHPHPSAHQRHSHAAFVVGAYTVPLEQATSLGSYPLALPMEQAVVYLAAYVVGAVGAMAAFGLGLGRLARWEAPEPYAHFCTAVPCVPSVWGLPGLPYPYTNATRVRQTPQAPLRPHGL